MQTQPEHTTAFILDCLEVLLPFAAHSKDRNGSNGSHTGNVAAQTASAAAGGQPPGAAPPGDPQQPAGSSNGSPVHPATAAEATSGASVTDISEVSAASAATAMHLLLDMAPGCLERVAPEAYAAAKARAAALLQGVLSRGAPPRLALKAAQAFLLGPADIEGFNTELASQVHGLLGDAATSTPAVGLLRHFQVPSGD